jgi:hypothetical protein
MSTPSRSYVPHFGKPQNAPMRLPALAFRYFDGADRTAANLRGELPDLVREAGFAVVAETVRHMTALGTLAFIRASSTA